MFLSSKVYLICKVPEVPKGFGDPEIRQEMLVISAGRYLAPAVTKRGAEIHQS